MAIMSGVLFIMVLALIIFGVYKLVTYINNNINHSGVPGSYFYRTNKKL